MNKITQACICIACITVVVVCLIVAFRKPASPDMEFLKQWEKAKQEYTQSVTAPLSKQIQELQEEVNTLKKENGEAVPDGGKPLRKKSPFDDDVIITSEMFGDDDDK